MRELRGCADCGRQNTSKVPRQGRPQKAGFGGCWRHPGLFQSAARGWNMLWTPCGSRGYLVAPPNPWFHTLQSYAACYAACKMPRIVVPVFTAGTSLEAYSAELSRARREHTRELFRPDSSLLLCAPSAARPRPHAIFEGGLRGSFRTFRSSTLFLTTLRRTSPVSS